MSDLNKIIITGRLGKAPEIRQTAKGDRVVNFTVATKYREETTWHRLVAWGKNADFVGTYMHKGDSIWAEGRMSFRDWEDDKGQKRSSAEMVVDQIGGTGGAKKASTEAPADYADGNTAQPDDGFDDIPF